MNLVISRQQGSKPVSVIHLEGKLDSNNFQDLIEEAKKLYASGARHLLLDMTKLTYISSAGIVALQAISKIFRGEALPDTEAGWYAIRSPGKERGGGKQHNVKLLKAAPEVMTVLDVVGVVDFYEMHTDLAAAVASF